MQGRRSVIGSLSETLDFEHGSSSSNPAIDAQIHWGNMMNSRELDMQDYLLPPVDAAYEGPNMSKWNLGESSSSTRPNDVSKQDERKSEHGWSSLLTASAGMGPRIQDWQHDPNSMFSLNNGNVNSNANQILNEPLFMQSSTSDGTPPNIDLNAGFVGHVEDDIQVEYPNAYKSSGSMNRHVASATCSSDHFGLPSGSNVRPESSVEGRSSHKRKAIDGNIGQSSVTGSSRYLHRAENIGWQPVTSRPVAARSLTLSTPSNEVAGPNTLENANPRLGLNLQAAGSGSHHDSTIATSQRNLRLRMSSPSPQESVPQNFVPSGNTYWSLNQQMARIPPVNDSIDLGQTLTVDNTNHQNHQPAVLQLHAQPQPVQSARLNVGSAPRHGTSTNSIIPGERMTTHHEEGSLRNMPRHLMEHPLFQPATELRSVTRSSTQRTLTRGNTSTPRNGASSTRNVSSRNGPSSTPRSGSSSSGHPSYAHPWVPHRPSSQHTQRLSEHVRRALLSTSGSDLGGLTGSHPPLQPGASASSQEAMLSLNHRNQSDVSLGIHSLRTLAAAGEGRSRLVSEIRSVLDGMRRGEALRIEDYMLLDQSMLFGVADAHDRHRDMRLDVDNMSYEELLALEERIGDVNTGLKEETILIGLKQQKYFSITIEPKSEDEPCSICREEYQDGEDLGVLSCGHDFHTACIKQWLGMKNLCPICKTTAINEKKT